MKKLNLFILVIAMVFIFTSCRNDEPEASNLPTAEQIAEQNLTKTELTVWGMTCNKCVRQISSTVSALDGVIGVSVDLKTEIVTVVYDSSIDLDTIKESITAEGYNLP
jgi:copper chaperone CopZ